MAPELVQFIGQALAAIVLGFGARLAWAVGQQLGLIGVLLGGAGALYLWGLFVFAAIMLAGTVVRTVARFAGL